MDDGQMQHQQRQQQQQQQRGRSPSTGRASHHLNGSASVSPHPPAPTDNSFQPSYTADSSLGAFDPQFAGDFQANSQYSLNPQATLLDFQQQQYQQSAQSIDLTNPTAFFQSQGGFQPQDSSALPYDNQGANISNHNLASNNLTLNEPSPQNTDTASFPNLDFNANLNQSLDPSLLYGTQLLDPQQQQSYDNSNTSIDQMAAMHPHSPTPPHLLQPNMRRSSQSPSPHASPAFQQTPFHEPARPRSESLDPASAAYPPHGYHGSDWASGHAFQGHRRTPSDAYSDISSHSAHASPYLGTSDSFDQVDYSPMLNAQQDQVLFPEGLGLGHFSLSDTQLQLQQQQQQQQQAHLSPGHSPHHSPRLMPQMPLMQQQTIPDYAISNGFGNSSDVSSQNVGQDYDMFPTIASEPFPQLSTNTSPGDMGQADMMSPPEIKFDFAPPSRQPSFGPPGAANSAVNLEDTLSPPERNRSRNRMRAKSDSHAGSRPSTPSINGRGRSPSLQPNVAGKDSLSPLQVRAPTSRSPSPSSHSSNSGMSRRSSTSSVPQRDYILDLANPERTTASGSDPKRVQKHPATFQCTLCPKKFTRAYNLRSHLRTHTDERPFVCTVCGKAFARQHDRKRHEGLHSGEKKFVCRGSLSTGEQWGCGRRFARADALGRHFRSEAGRVCIRPLLQEEANERQRQWQAEHAQQQLQSSQGFVAPPPLIAQPQLQPMLPAALLQLYPEFANLDWGAISAAPDNEGYSGRSSFDASSGGEWDAFSENEMGDMGDMGDMNEMGGYGNQQANGGAPAMGMGVNGWHGQDYMSDFEGR
ncbi:hypothetical protein MBLNU459_g6121t1 [Dothideomycetes sp. NU459]